MPNGIDVKRAGFQFSAFVGLSLLLSACGGGLSLPDPTPDPTPTEQTGLIKGQVTPFKAGDATSVSAGAENDKEQPIATTPVAADGKFDLGLPKSSVMTSQFSGKLVKPEDVFGCDATQTQSVSSAPNMLLLPIEDLKTNNFQSIIAEIDSTSKTFNYKAWWFSTVDGNFKFKGDCLLRGEIDTNLTFKKGWNVVDTYTDTQAGTTTYAVTSQPTAYIPWKFATSAATSLSLRGQSVQLSENYFTPWKNLPQYRNR